MNLTMIRYNKKNVCVLPIISKYLPILKEYYKNDPNKRMKANSLYIICGVNYIPTEYWRECLQHKMIQILIKDRIIEEIQNNDPENEKIKIEKENIIKEKEDNKNILTELKTEVKKTEKEANKIENKNEKKLKKESIKKLKNKIEEKEEKVKELNKKENTINKELDNLNAFKALTKKQKEKVIIETFDIRSLKKFFDEEINADIRHMIQLRIEEIQNTKTDETIGHPKSHLKTSGK